MDKIKNFLTFKRQMIIGLSGFVIGSVLTWLLHKDIFQRLGIGFYGFLFFINPAITQQAESVVKNKKALKIALRILGLVILISSITLKCSGLF